MGPVEKNGVRGGFILIWGSPVKGKIIDCLGDGEGLIDAKAAKKGGGDVEELR